MVVVVIVVFAAAVVAVCGVGLVAFVVPVGFGVFDAATVSIAAVSCCSIPFVTTTDCTDDFSSSRRRRRRRRVSSTSSNRSSSVCCCCFYCCYCRVWRLVRVVRRCCWIRGVCRCFCLNVLMMS